MRTLLSEIARVCDIKRSDGQDRVSSLFTVRGDGIAHEARSMFGYDRGSFAHSDLLLLPAVKMQQQMPQTAAAMVVMLWKLMYHCYEKVMIVYQFVRLNCTLLATQEANRS